MPQQLPLPLLLPLPTLIVMMPKPGNILTTRYVLAFEYDASSIIGPWSVPQGSPKGQTLRALLLRGTSVPH